MDPNSEEFSERVRVLANSILERFNEEQVTPQEAGYVILALAHRLMTVLEKNPEDRQNFVLQFISLVNQYLAGELEEGVGLRCGGGAGHGGSAAPPDAAAGP